MNVYLARCYVLSIIIFSAMFLIPVSASAELPWLDIAGSFDYSYGTCTKTGGPTGCKEWSYDYTLTLTGWNITGGNYADGTNFGEESEDPITNAWIEINGTSNTLYNDAYPDNLSFDDTAGPGGNVATFTIKDGSTTYLTATLANFLVDDVTNDFGTYTELNKYQDDDNITNVIYGSGTGSQYINELSGTAAPFNLSWEFTFTGGENAPYGDGTAFTENSSGSFQGKMYAGPVVPEPVSSVLFVTGGALLAFRRYKRKAGA